VLVTVKVRPGSVAERLTLAATADLDGVCARRLSAIARSGRRNGRQIEQRNWACAAAPVIDPATPRSAPIRAVLPAHDALA
jgi:hypothetical protein